MKTILIIALTSSIITIIILSALVELQKRETEKLKNIIVKMREFPDLETWQKWHAYQIGVEVPDSSVAVDVYDVVNVGKEK